MGSVKGIFITGTDTGVGKTLISCALAKILSRQCRVGVMKPLAAGSSQDAENLQRASGRSDLKLKDINPIFFEKPLAPFSATHFGKKKINLSKIFESFEKIQASSDFVIVEGMGGLHVPVTDRWMVADLALQMNLPLIIVTRLGLGTLNHTLLTVDYARTKKISIAGIVVNTTSRRKDLSTQTNVQALSRLTRLPVLGPIPYLQGGFFCKLETLLSENHLSQKKLENLFL